MVFGLGYSNYARLYFKMKGCRSFTPEECTLIKAALNTRDRAIFVLGIRAGFRITEILSLDVGDYSEGNGLIKVRRCNVKGRTEGQTVPLHHEAIEALKAYLEACPGLVTEPMFRSLGTGGRKDGGRLTDSVYRKALKEAATRAKIHDLSSVSTHSMRKTFAKNLMEFLDGNIFKLQKAMRHKNITSTTNYVEVSEDEISNAIRGVK